MAVNKNTILDNLPVFTSFEPVENKMELDKEDDFFNLELPEKKEIVKYLLVQCKGEKSNLFPKIKPMDFLFVSNYSMENLKDSIKEIPEVSIHFELTEKHIGKSEKYFRDLFFAN